MVTATQTLVLVDLDERKAVPDPRRLQEKDPRRSRARRSRREAHTAPRGDRPDRQPRRRRGRRPPRRRLRSPRAWTHYALGRDLPRGGRARLGPGGRGDETSVRGQARGARRKRATEIADDGNADPRICVPSTRSRSSSRARRGRRRRARTTRTRLRLHCDDESSTSRLISPYCLVGWDTGGEAWSPVGPDACLAPGHVRSAPAVRRPALTLHLSEANLRGRAPARCPRNGRAPQLWCPLPLALVVLGFAPRAIPRTRYLARSRDDPSSRGTLVARVG